MGMAVTWRGATAAPDVALIPPAAPAEEVATVLVVDVVDGAGMVAPCKKSVPVGDTATTRSVCTP